MGYDIIGMTNFAHGEVYMIAAFISVITFVVLQAASIGYVPLILVVMLTPACCPPPVYGWSIERIAHPDDGAGGLQLT